MDFGARGVQLWIPSTEPPGEHPYEKETTTTSRVYLVESAPFRGLDKGS